MFHLLACIYLESGVMTIDQKLPHLTGDPVEIILSVANLRRSEVGVLSWDVVEGDSTQTVDCAALTPATIKIQQPVLQDIFKFQRTVILKRFIQNS